MTTVNYDWFQSITLRMIEIRESNSSARPGAYVTLEEVESGELIKVYVEDPRGIIYGEEFEIRPRVKP